LAYTCETLQLPGALPAPARRGCAVATGLQETITFEREMRPDDRPFAVIVRCADTCNYACTYCYSRPEEVHGLMTAATAANVMDKVAAYCGTRRRIHFVWHGGEPLLGGMRFFQSIARKRRELSGHRIENSVQTNGFLLRQPFVDFCVAEGIRISTSVDGPEAVHDINRMDKKGRGTFAHTMKAVDLLRANALPVSCVTVLHRRSIGRMREIYEFFRDNRISFRVNPVVKVKDGANSYNELAISPQEYGDTMCELFDWWYEDDPKIRIEPFHTILGNFCDDQVWGCDYHGQCLRSIISVNPNGDVYPCGRFTSESAFRLGNINECASLREVLAGDLYETLSRRDASTIEGCGACRFGPLCNGGCMVTGYMARGEIFDKDYYCAGRKQLFQHVLDRLQESLSRCS
jgi:uncharacterized protein